MISVPIPDPTDDRTMAACRMQSIKNDLWALDKLPRSVIEPTDLEEVEELLGRLWRPRARAA